MNDEIILKKLRTGNPDGLQHLMDRYIPYVSSIVWSLLRFSMTREDAEGVVSDVFLAAWNQAAELRAESIKAWLGAVARNKAKNKLRAIGCELPLEEDALLLPDEATPEGHLSKAEEGRLVRCAVDSLGEPDREIFLRHYYYAQTVREISGKMLLNESTIKTKLRRGRTRLKEILTRWGAV